MAHKQTPHKDMAVVAELTITSPLGAQVVRGWETAWMLLQTLPTPVTSRFDGFVRRDHGDR